LRATDDALAVLVLPTQLEGFELEAHARDLLSIPRVVALEPSSVRTPRFLRDAASLRQARRLRFPGRLRLVVLYHPEQYGLTRALCAHHEEVELWYIPPGGDVLGAAGQAQTEEWLALDELAREAATAMLSLVEGSGVEDAPLRRRLLELDVINPRPFVPRARSRW
jgi:hypothetical protein